MNRTQRLVLVLYFLLLTYCCVWIPWCLPMHVANDATLPAGPRRVGYGWLWSGPNDEAVGGAWRSAGPDVSLILLRIAAASAIGAAAMALAGTKISPTRTGASASVPAAPPPTASVPSEAKR